jgi:tRNA modification GTPase
VRLNDTIVAISTPPGRGGIGVVRLSGDQALPIAQRLLPALGEIASHQAKFCFLVDERGERVDEVIATYFAAPRSFTTQDVVEISCHGAPVILRFCLERAVACGARLAEAGEFSLRAYLHGRMDLSQAEALRDLIEATTLYQAKVAAQQLGGSLSRKLGPLKARLVELISLLEAGIDFAEDDVSVASNAALLERLEPLQADLQRLERSFAYGRLVHGGAALAIVGRPNVGKSSLFNALLEQERAIVTDIPGTTRDTVSEAAAIHGLPIRFIDTAGIRESADVVESLGIERSREAIADADLVLLVLDQSQEMSPEDLLLLQVVQGQGRYLLVANKADLPAQAKLPEPAISVAAATGEGIEGLREAIFQALSPEGLWDASSGFLTSLRQRECGLWPRRTWLLWSRCRMRCCCWIFMRGYEPWTGSAGLPLPTTS